LTEESFAPDLDFALTHSPPHQIGDDGTLVPITECFVELHLNFIGYAEIDGRHKPPILLKYSTIQYTPVAESFKPNFRGNLSHMRLMKPSLISPIAGVHERQMGLYDHCLAGGIFDSLANASHRVAPARGSQRATAAERSRSEPLKLSFSSCARIVETRLECKPMPAVMDPFRWRINRKSA
jgi:hypothetical protein